MNGVKEFVAQFVQTEKALQEAFRREDFATHRKLVAALNAMSFDVAHMVLAADVQLPLSMIHEMVLEEVKELPVFERRIYKITQYQNATYHDVWLAYVSVANPSQGADVISNCYAVANIEGELRFLSSYFPDYDSRDWKFGGGDPDLHDFDKLGVPVVVEHLLVPTVDAWSIAEYNKHA